MERLSIPWKGWVVVCDGAKALVLENAGDATHLDLKTLDIALQHVPPDRDLGTERPGRVHESVGASRSAVELPDLHDAAETAFLKHLAERLDAAVKAHGAAHLVLVAPPRALGVLRDALSPAVRSILAGEVAKDLTHLTVGEIEEHLAA